MILEYKDGKYYMDGVEVDAPTFNTAYDSIQDDIIITNDITIDDVVTEDPIETKVAGTPIDIPCVYFDGILPTSKDQGNYKGAAHLRGSIKDDCYATLKVQGNSSTAYNKKNFTITFYSDAACTSKKKIDFGWGPQSKYVMKANWIDITHSRNVVSARLWGDVVKSRTDYDTLPELLRTSPNQGAIDGFPIKFYGDDVYWGRYTMNIPKDPWMTNMDKTNPEHLILCGENYNEALFRAPAVWDETDWTDELHSEVPAELLARFNELVSFIMTSSNDDFNAHLSDYVDLQSVIDYYVFGLLICNLDGFGKNHIWLSYDGNKFIASAYDMDSTFGLYWDGSQLLSATYGRNQFEDMTGGRPGNLLYLRLVENFEDGLQEAYTRLVDGPMSFVNVLDRFENFIDIAPASLVAEDYTGTTGNGACTGIPSVDTNNIQQIRQWYATRIAYVKAQLGVIDAEDDIELPEPFAFWENLQFDGDATKRTPLNTGYHLFSDYPEWQVWTLQFHAKINSGTSGQRSAVHCMDETGDPWPGLVMQTQNADANGAITEIRMTKTSSGNIEGITFNNGAEQYIAIQRNGDVMKYCIDGKTWNTFPGTIFTHNSPLVLGGYCNGNGQVLGGADGREINGVVTARLWKENLDNVAKLFIETFPEDLYDFDHTWSQMSFDALDGMSTGQSVEVSMVNPNATNGYVLGYNAGELRSTGVSTLNLTKINLDQHSGDDYKMIISKVAETRTEQQENNVARTFTVACSTTPTSISTSISGYNLWRVSGARNATRTITVTFDGTQLPRTVYVKAYNSGGTHTITISGGTGTVTSSTNQTVTSLSNFTAVSMTSATMTITAKANNTNATYYTWILVPNNVTEVVVTDVEVLTGNEYYTIKSKTGNYSPNVVSDGNVVTWSTSNPTFFNISNPATFNDATDITTDMNPNSNPNIIRFTTPDGEILNAGGDGGLKYATGTGSWSIWNLWLMDGTSPR